MRKYRQPVVMSTSSADDSMSPSPVASNAPKFGTLIPNRIFVGGISLNTTEPELQALFSTYGRVKAAKIIQDRAGVSKGYGFVTFETEEEAKRIQKVDVILRDRKLNIAPAIRKQPFAMGYTDSTPSLPSGVLYQNGVPYTYQNGMAVFGLSENMCSYNNPQANYPVIFPSSMFVPQQSFPCATTTTLGSPYAGTSVPELAQYMPYPMATQYYVPDQNY